jgi:hypothetical protein
MAPVKGSSSLYAARDLVAAAASTPQMRRLLGIALNVTLFEGWAIGLATPDPTRGVHRAYGARFDGYFVLSTCRVCKVHG